MAQVSRTIARALRLNEDLTEAIALAHDLGHPPFGHTGERILNDLFEGGFHHYLQSVRIARFIEKLNLSLEITDSIAKDTGHEEPACLEGQVVKMADRMAARPTQAPATSTTSRAAPKTSPASGTRLAPTSRTICC